MTKTVKTLRKRVLRKVAKMVIRVSGILATQSWCSSLREGLSRTPRWASWVYDLCRPTGPMLRRVLNLV